MVGQHDFHILPFCPPVTEMSVSRTTRVKNFHLHLPDATEISYKNLIFKTAYIKKTNVSLSNRQLLLGKRGILTVTQMTE